MIVTTTVPSSSTSTDAQHPEVLEGQHRHLRVGDRGGDRRAPSRAGSHASPPPHRVGAGDRLHLGEQVARAPRCAGRRGPCRRLTGPTWGTSGRSTPLTENTCSSTTSTSSATVDGSTPTPAAATADSTGWVAEQLVVQRPTSGSAGQQPAPGLVGALREGEEPPARVVAVVGDLLDALGRDRREHVVARGAPAARAAPAARSRTAAAARSSRRSRRCRPRRAARCGTRGRRGRTPARPRPAPASPRAAPGRTDGSAAAARASSSRAWPSRSSAMLASAMSSSRSGARLHHSESRWE